VSDEPSTTDQRSHKDPRTRAEAESGGAAPPATTSPKAPPASERWAGPTSVSAASANNATPADATGKGGGGATPPDRPLAGTTLRAASPRTTSPNATRTRNQTTRRASNARPSIDATSADASRVTPTADPRVAHRTSGRPVLADPKAASSTSGTTTSATVTATATATAAEAAAIPTDRLLPGTTLRDALAAAKAGSSVPDSISAADEPVDDEADDHGEDDADDSPVASTNWPGRASAKAAARDESPTSSTPAGSASAAADPNGTNQNPWGAGSRPKPRGSAKPQGSSQAAHTFAATRSVARKLALQALYRWQLNDGPWQDLVLEFGQAEDMRNADREYFRELVEGVWGSRQALDARLAELMDRPPEQLDPVEHAVLLMGLYELMSRPEVPYRVSINEAVGLTKRFGATDGHKFVNAVLDRAARALRSHED
jgi:N utilization substance protein B